MDLTLLRSFLVVVQAGAITDAADRLNVTQPALTRRIQQLEQEMGVPLLARGRKGVTTTAIGELVAREAQVLVERYEQLRQQIASLRELKGGTVRLGGGATAVSFLLPQALARFQSEHPGVRFQVTEAGSRDVELAVASGRLELGVVTVPVASRELDVYPLIEDEIVLIAEHSHRLARRQRITVAQLAGTGLVGFEGGSAIRRIIDNALREAGADINVVMELRSIPAIIRMVEATGNLAFVSRLGVSGVRSMRIIAVAGLTIRRTLALVSRRGGVLSPAAEAFANELKAAQQG